MLWVDRHAPAKAGDLVGNRDAVREVEKWLASWKRGEKACLLYGPPGVGKTSLAHIVAREAGLEVVEMNTSNLRNREQVNDVLGRAGMQASLLGGGRLLLVDEVDGLSGKGRGGDYGGVGAISEVISKSAYPVILTANKVILSEGGASFDIKKWEAEFAKRFRGKKPGKFEIFSFLRDVMRAEAGPGFNGRMLWAITYANLAKVEREGARPLLLALPLRAGGNWWEWNAKLSPLRSKCRLVEFSEPTTADLAARLARIAKAEGVSADESVFSEIATRAGGDVRAAITMLETVSRGRKRLTPDDLSAVEGRDRGTNVERAVRLVLSTTDPRVARSAFRDLDMPQDEFARYLSENLPGRYRDPAELAAAYRSLSDADRAAGRNRRIGSYFLLPYQVDFGTAGVSSAKAGRAKVEGRIVWPASRYDASTVKARRLAKSIAAKAKAKFPFIKARKAMFLIASDRGIQDALELDADEREALSRLWLPKHRRERR